MTMDIMDKHTKDPTAKTIQHIINVILNNKDTYTHAMRCFTEDTMNHTSVREMMKRARVDYPNFETAKHIRSISHALSMRIQSIEGGKKSTAIQNGSAKQIANLLFSNHKSSARLKGRLTVNAASVLGLMTSTGYIWSKRVQTNDNLEEIADEVNMMLAAPAEEGEMKIRGYKEPKKGIRPNTVIMDDIEENIADLKTGPTNSLKDTCLTYTDFILLENRTAEFHQIRNRDFFKHSGTATGRISYSTSKKQENKMPNKITSKYKEVPHYNGMLLETKDDRQIFILINTLRDEMNTIIAQAMNSKRAQKHVKVIQQDINLLIKYVDNR